MEKPDQNRFEKSRRIVTRSGGILRGEFASCRFQSQIKWEEGIEKDFLALIEFSARVKNVISQPFKAIFVADGNRTSRTPDFLVDMDHERIIVECKPEERLKDPRVIEHLRAAENQFVNHGYRYEVVTDKTIRCGNALRNAKRLLRYRLRPLQQRHEIERIHQCKELLREKHTSLTFSDAVSLLGSETDVFVLIASGLVHIDFQLPITSETIISFDLIKESPDAASFLFTK